MQKPVILKVLLFLAVISLASSMKFQRMLVVADPFCAQFNNPPGQCQSCICRYYFDQNHKCQQVSDLCKTWNINTGKCTSCYVGYELVNGACPAINTPMDHGDDKEVVIFNPNCLTQEANGTCLTCRPFYTLHCGDCLVTGQNPNCTQFRQNSTTCVACDPTFILDSNSICQQTPVPTTNCSQFQSCFQCTQFQCTTCEDGFRLQYLSKLCVVPTTNCSFNCDLCSLDECFACAAGYSSQGFPPCQSCSVNYAFDSKGRCEAIQSDCSKFPNCDFCVTTECLGCDVGFVLNPDGLSCV